MSHTTLIGELISIAFNNPGFTWICSPACTELENIVVDWVAKMVGLPDKFLLKNEGGGSIQTTIGTNIFLSIHSAKMKKMKELSIELDNPKILKFVGYWTGIGHSENPKGLEVKDIPHRKMIPIYWNETI